MFVSVHNLRMGLVSCPVPNRNRLSPLQIERSQQLAILIRTTSLSMPPAKSGMIKSLIDAVVMSAETAAIAVLFVFCLVLAVCASD
jgi:hypothetical protein